MEKTIEFVRANLPAIVEQLKSCRFVCEGGKLENNTAFIELERIAKSKFDIVAVCLENLLDSESIEILEAVLKRIKAYNRGNQKLGRMNIKIVVAVDD